MRVRTRNTRQNTTTPKTKERKKSLLMKTILPGSSSPDRRGVRPYAPTAVSLPVENGIYRIAALSSYPELLHGISTRTSPDGDDWNLSGRRGTPQHPPGWDRALANRETLARRLGIGL